MPTQRKRFYKRWWFRIPVETADGGKFDRERRLSPGSDMVFELFDPQHRRQPAPPKPVDPDENE